MGSVLGIDAAWVEKNPSGVALVTVTTEGARLEAVEASYDRFHARAQGFDPLSLPVAGSRPDAKGLLASARAIGQQPVDLVAIDMPLAHSPITGRRTSDTAVSKEYGARKASTHSPNEHSPGAISDRLRVDFEQQGYSLGTDRIVPPSLIEVYPHPALIHLCGASERLPYKVSKARAYWKGLTSSERRRRLIGVWEGILDSLEVQLSGVRSLLPLPSESSNNSQLKAFEDSLDAVVCAWVGVQALKGRARPLGDADSAIWIPQE